MKIKWLGHACFLITANDGTKIMTDPYQPGGFGGAIKYGKFTEPVDIVTVSHEHADHNYVKGIPGTPHIVKGESTKTFMGTKPVKEIVFKGIASYHDNSKGAERGKNTIFYFTVDNISICHLGDLGQILPENTIQQLLPTDVLLIPVGGYFTIGPNEATEIVNALKPRIVIPMHYKTEKVDFPISGVDEFLQNKTNVKRIKGSEIELEKHTLPEQTEIIVLEPAL